MDGSSTVVDSNFNIPKNLEKHHPKEKNTKEKKKPVCELLIIVDLQWQQQQQQNKTNKLATT